MGASVRPSARWLAQYLAFEPREKAGTVVAVAVDLGADDA
jgi:hypothetical protein